MEYMTEAEALANIEEDREDYDDIIDGAHYERFKHDRELSINSDLEAYYRNKQAKVGTEIICAENRCKKRFKKKSYQQAFCCSKHRIQFWNRQQLNYR